MKIAFILSNSAVPDEMPHSMAFHLGLHCLLKYPLGVYCIQRVKGDADMPQSPTKEKGNAYELLRDSNMFLNLLITFFLISGDICRLLIIFAISLDPDQDLQNVDPDLDTNSLMVFS